jgi:hypothetical protein
MTLILEPISYEDFLIDLMDVSKTNLFVSDENDLYQVSFNQNQLKLIDSSGILHSLDLDMRQFKKTYHSYFKARSFKLDSDKTDKNDSSSNQQIHTSQLSSRDEHLDMLVRYTIDDAISFAKQYTRNFDKNQLIVNDRKEIIGVICNNIFYVSFDVMTRLAERNNIKFHFKPYTNIYKYARYWQNYLLKDENNELVITETIQLDDELIKSSHYKYNQADVTHSFVFTLPIDLSKV